VYLSQALLRVLILGSTIYCPRAVTLAHQLALASDWITADMVEAMEFPHLANRYQVYGVPHTVVNEVIHVEGAAPEARLVAEVMTVLDEAEMSRRREHWEAHLKE